MSYVGGGSDLPAFYHEETGAVLSTAIDKYMYVTLHDKFDSGVRVAYSKTEEVKSSSEAEHHSESLTCSTRHYRGWKLPPLQTYLQGHGRESTVILLGFWQPCMLIKRSFTPEDLAGRYVTRNRRRRNYRQTRSVPRSLRSLNLIDHPDESVTVKAVNEARFQALLDACTLIFYTGQTRAAKSILAKQKTVTSQPAKRRILRRMAALSYEFKNGIESRSLEHLGELLRENWALKRQLTAGISNSAIDAMYDIGMENGALGGKLLGAGAGGFMMFLVKPENNTR